MNYGAIGVVIGHEISHGFDDQGAQFDAQGRLNNWWTPEDLKEFQAKTAVRGEAVRRLLHRARDIHHQGKLVLGESIGDLAGVKIAYLRVQESAEGKPDDRKSMASRPISSSSSPGDSSAETKHAPETQRMMVQGDPHPVAKYRVIGPMSNFPPFASAFSCKAGSPMVRAAGEECVVW